MKQKYYSREPLTAGNVKGVRPKLVKSTATVLIDDISGAMLFQMVGSEYLDLTSFLKLM